jgi:hypothetical protein
LTRIVGTLDAATTSSTEQEERFETAAAATGAIDGSAGDSSDSLTGLRFDLISPGIDLHPLEDIPRFINETGGIGFHFVLFAGAGLALSRLTDAGIVESNDLLRTGVSAAVGVANLALGAIPGVQIGIDLELSSGGDSIQRAGARVRIPLDLFPAPVASEEFEEPPPRPED